MFVCAVKHRSAAPCSGPVPGTHDCTKADALQSWPCCVHILSVGLLYPCWHPHNARDRPPAYQPTLLDKAEPATLALHCENAYGDVLLRV